MGFVIRRMFTAAAMVALVTGSLGAQAETPAAAPPAVQDQAMSRAMAGIATVLMLQFAAGMANGSVSEFDPGPVIEQTIKGALASRELDRVIEAMTAQAAGSAEGSGMSPQMRAAMALVLRQAVAAVRRELSADLRRD